MQKLNADQQERFDDAHDLIIEAFKRHLIVLADNLFLGASGPTGADEANRNMRAALYDEIREIERDGKVPDFSHALDTMTRFVADLTTQITLRIAEQERGIDFKPNVAPASLDEVTPEEIFGALGLDVDGREIEKHDDTGDDSV